MLQQGSTTVTERTQQSSQVVLADLDDGVGVIAWAGFV
tara:strand:+ start:316 stop:429 length:114 start_codon:yes stop_codon:yes gene_type:complete